MSDAPAFKAPFSRSDLVMLRKAIRESWPVLDGRRAEITEALKAQRETASPRLQAAIDETFALMGASPTR